MCSTPALSELLVNVKFCFVFFVFLTHTGSAVYNTSLAPRKHGHPGTTIPGLHPNLCEFFFIIYYYF